MESSHGTESHRGKPGYSGEDTRLTSEKELSGWYSYGFAAEVFVVCGGRLSLSSKSGPVGRTSRVVRHVSAAFTLETYLRFYSLSKGRNADSEFI